MTSQEKKSLALAPSSAQPVSPTSTKTSQQKNTLAMAPAIPPRDMNGSSQGKSRPWRDSGRKEKRRAKDPSGAAIRGQSGTAGGEINNPNVAENSQTDNIAEDDSNYNEDHENDVVIDNAQVVGEETAEDLDAALAAQLAQQVKQQVEARLQAQRQSTYDVANVVAIPSSTKSSPDSDQLSTIHICGLPRLRLLIILLVVTVLALVGIVIGVVVASSSSSDNDDPEFSKELQQRLEPWIIRNDKDRLAFENPASPQSLALTWLSSDPIGLSTTSSATSRGVSFQVLLERYVVAVLYYATSGRNWNKNDALFADAFMSESDTCAWNNGLNPIQNDLARGVFCEEGRDVVNYICLDSVNLVGTLPWELSLLSNLVGLRMSFNLLSGTLPTELSDLTMLELFTAFRNSLTGPLPPTLPPSMHEIDLSTNDLTGTIPSTWGQSGSNVIYLNLETNKLSGSMPTEIGQLTKLQYLYVRDNKLSGTIPEELGQFTFLEHFHANHNVITGTIPSALSKMTALITLHVHANKLKGTIPTEMGLLMNLTELRIDENELTGTIPSELAQLTKMAVFSLFKNHLKGSVNDTLCKSSSQEWIRLQSDCLDGTNGPAEVECSCCTACCNEEGDYCPEVEF